MTVECVCVFLLCSDHRRPLSQAESRGRTAESAHRRFVADFAGVFAIVAVNVVWCISASLAAEARDVGWQGGSAVLRAPSTCA